MSEYQHINEFLQTGIGTEGQLLIPRKIHDTLIEEAGKNLIPRSEAAIYIGPSMIPGSSYDLDLEAEDAMDVREIGEGTEIFLDQDEYSNVNLKPVKYGVAIRITKEMEEDSKWPLLQRNINKAGKRFAENENSLIITDALDNAANTVSGGAAITIPNITRGMQYLEDSDYDPTSYFIGTEVLNDLRNIDTFVEADKLGSTEMLTKGFVGVIFSMRVFKVSTNAGMTTTSSYITDREHAYVIAEKRTVTVEGFALPNFDMSGAALTQRIKVKGLRSNAACKITTT